MSTRRILVDKWNGAEVDLTSTGSGAQVRPETGDSKFQQLMKLADAIRSRNENPVAYDVVTGVEIPFVQESPESSKLRFMYIYLEKPRGRPDRTRVLGVRLTVNEPVA
jgi:hypothetical protein